MMKNMDNYIPSVYPAHGTYESTMKHQASLSPNSTAELITERGKTHGNFSDNAKFSQAFKRLVEDCGRSALNDEQREALEMIGLKISRILSGDPNVKDHWDDMGGYAKLGSDACR